MEWFGNAAEDLGSFQLSVVLRAHRMTVLVPGVTSKSRWYSLFLQLRPQQACDPLVQWPMSL